MVATVLAIEGTRPRPRRGAGRFTAFLRAFMRDRQALAGLVIVAVAGGAAVAAPLISPWDPLKSVEVVRALGAGSGRVLWRHLVPNVLPPLLVYTSTLVGLMIVASSGLSFLGLGVQPPTPDWGVMVGSGRLVIYRAAHVATIPGVIIVIVALGFNFIGDGLREALDPRARQ